MAFEWDVCISYAHTDNQPIRVGEEGWVTRFHRLLETRLTQLTGTTPKILCRADDASPDPKQTDGGRATGTMTADSSPPTDFVTDSESIDTTPAYGNQEGHSNSDTMETVAALVSVVSPQSVRSRGCAQALQSFTRAAARTGGLWVEGSLTRLFKVVRFPVLLERQPRELRGVLSHNCFEWDGDRLIEFGRTATSDNHTSSEGSTEPDRGISFETDCGFAEDLKFLQIIDDLAYDIHKLLDALAVKTNTSPKKADAMQATRPLRDEAEGKVIYLAETNSQLVAIRDEVRRELELSGHWVLPDRPLPRSKSFTEEIQASLALCDLSVHLLGVDDALTTQFPASPLSSPPLQSSHLEMARVRTQIKLAANRLGDTGFSQILWVPGTRERDYWETILETLPGLPEVLLSGVEGLKTAIQTYLEHDSPIFKTSNCRTNFSRKVYVDFERQDEGEPVLIQLRNWLSERFEVLAPNYSSGEGVSSSEAKLRQADGVLIYYGQGSDVWLRRRLNALRKTCSAERSPVPRAVYIGPPATLHKHNLNVTQVSVLHPSEPFSADVLQPFATRITNVPRGVEG
ncbi:MAG: hypothetical protein AB4050_19215 [Synechococcus sp.]